MCAIVTKKPLLRIPKVSIYRYYGVLPAGATQFLVDAVGITGYLFCVYHYFHNVAPDKARARHYLDETEMLVWGSIEYCYLREHTAVGIYNQGIMAITIIEWDTTVNRFRIEVKYIPGLYRFRNSYSFYLKNLDTVTDADSSTAIIVAFQYASREFRFTPTQTCFEKSALEIKQMSRFFEGVIKGYLTLNEEEPGKPCLTIITPDGVREDEVLKVLVENGLVSLENPYWKWP